MDRATILKAFETNLWDKTSFLVKARKDAEVQDTQDLLVVDSGLPSKALNTIGRSTLHPRFALDRIELAVKRFRAKSAPFSWILGPQSGHGAMEGTLKDLGLACPEEEWIMAMPLDTGSVPSNLPAGLSIKQVAGAEQIEQFANVLANSTTPPDENLKTFFADTKEAVLKPSPLKLFVGYVNNEPVAVLETFNAHGIMNFYSMATLTSTRGKGYAGALLLNALRDAKKAGLRLAGLQTPEAGRALYERIGFKPVGRIATFS
jgi:ribosomal protein S18 acetylase RimI-like enzyme